MPHEAGRHQRNETRLALRVQIGVVAALASEADSVAALRILSKT
jgi:hypothetical protein